MGGGLCIQSGWLRRDKTSGNCSASFYKIIPYSLANGWTHANQLPLIFMSHWIRRTQIDLICWSKQLELNSGCRTFTWKKTYPFPPPSWNHLPCYRVAKKRMCVWVIPVSFWTAQNSRMPDGKQADLKRGGERGFTTCIQFLSTQRSDSLFLFSGVRRQEWRTAVNSWTQDSQSNQITGCLAFKPL